MTTCTLDTIRKGLAEIIGLEGTDTLIREALDALHLPQKDVYSREEYAAVCERLKARGGTVRIMMSLIMARDVWQE